MAPLETPLSHDKAHGTARRLVSRLAAKFSEKYILSAQAQRRGRIFLDYLRNGRGTTAIGTWSPRARGISDRRAGDLGKDRARDQAGCVYDDAAVSGGVSTRHHTEKPHAMRRLKG
jgi:hypothetical protein